MLRKIGLGIAYFVAMLYLASIVLPAIYCLHHGCRGPELDAFMPAFMLTPAGGIATAFALRNAVQQTRKEKASAAFFWVLALIFGLMLVGVVGLGAYVILGTVFHR